MTPPSVPPAAPYLVKVDPLVLPLLPEYLRNRAGDLVKLDAALAAGDFPALRKLGHNMRGSAGAYGLPPLSDIGARMEDAAVQRDSAAVADAVAAMRAFLPTVKLPT
jgi:HPt (histidine-containing phosphotransfer) domain-containing protein